MFALKAFWLQEYIKDRTKKRSAALILQAFRMQVLYIQATPFSVGEQISRATVLMESASLCSTILGAYGTNCPLGPVHGQDGNEIELLKDQLTEVERRLEESQNEIGAVLEILRRTIHQLQRTRRQVERLPENGSHANIQFQVGYCKYIFSTCNYTYINGT